MNLKTTEEAVQALFGGQVNIKKASDSLGISLELMKKEFEDYVKNNSVQEDAWLKDIEISWPYTT